MRMTKMQKIKNILIAISMILMAALFILDSDLGYDVIVILLSVYFIVNGIRTLWFFFTMAPRMVGGRRILYQGILILNLGIFTMVLNVTPTVYVMLYLCGVYLFTGGIDIMNAVDAKKMGSPFFKRKLITGIINVLIGVLCVVFLRDTEMLVYVFAGGFIYKAVIRIIATYQKSEMVYVQ